MSKYTTGELAKLCGVTVRTVQYYDTRGILIPSELSEGGRRLYSEDDLKRMKIICFLRELDLPIDAISQILKEEHPSLRGYRQPSVWSHRQAYRFLQQQPQIHVLPLLLWQPRLKH